MISNNIYHRTGADEAVHADFFKILRALKCFSPELIQKAMDEVHYKDKPTYPEGKGDPIKDLSTLGQSHYSITDQPMEPTKEISVEVETSSEAPTTTKIDPALAEKVMEIAKKIGFSEEVISAMKKECGMEEEKPSEPTPTEKPKAGNDLIEMLKKMSN